MKSSLALPLQQTHLHAAALKLLGRQVHAIAIAPSTKVIAVAKFGQLLTSRGPVWADEVSATEKTRALRKSGLRLINADADDETALYQAGYRRLMTPAHVAELDLRGTQAARIAGQKPKWRNAWRGAPDVRISQQQFDPQLHGWILDADLEQQRTKRFRGLPHALLRAYATRDPQAVQVFTAQDFETPIAAMIFLLHKPVATYHIGWTSARGREHCAHHKILIQAADIFSENGFERLDLGQVDTINASGLARFKIGCGADVRPLGGTWLRLPGR